jgi:PEP-CTERM motif-containing protein
MKLIPRIISISFLLISINMFADTIRFDLNSNVLMGPNSGGGDNVGVTLSGQGVFIFAVGGTPAFWLDGSIGYYPGQEGLGPTTILWDTAYLQIGALAYDFGQFGLAPTDLDVPGITFPTNGKDFTVSIPWAWALFGTINTNCPSSGCGFFLASKPGKLSFSFIYEPTYGIYFANSVSFSTVPEPATFTFMAIGIAAVGWRRFRAC